MKKSILVTATLLALLILGCNKIESPDPIPPQGFAEIKAPQQFSWETTRSVTIRTVGLPVPYPVFHTLRVNLPDEQVILEQRQDIRESSSYSVRVPVSVNVLTITCSTLSKTLEIINGEVIFTFIPDNIE